MKKKKNMKSKEKHHKTAIGFENFLIKIFDYHVGAKKKGGG